MPPEAFLQPLQAGWVGLESSPYNMYCSFTETYAWQLNYPWCVCPADMGSFGLNCNFSPLFPVWSTVTCSVCWLAALFKTFSVNSDTLRSTNIGVASKSRCGVFPRCFGDHRALLIRWRPCGLKHDQKNMRFLSCAHTHFLQYFLSSKGICRLGCPPIPRTLHVGVLWCELDFLDFLIFLGIHSRFGEQNRWYMPLHFIHALSSLREVSNHLYFHLRGTFLDTFLRCVDALAKETALLHGPRLGRVVGLRDLSLYFTAKDAPCPHQGMI